MLSVVNDKTIRIGNQDHAHSMDPQSLNESLQLSVTGNVYEGLTARNKDLRLHPRQAFYQAIDFEGIKRIMMRGVANPTALVVSLGINGFDAAMNKRVLYDTEAAKKLMAEAGYAAGFEVSMNCPNDRCVNDGEISQAVIADAF